MGINPMDMKALVIQETINSLESQDKKEKIRNIDLLGKTIGIGGKTGLEGKAIEALEKVAKEKDEEIQKAAEEALTMIRNRPSSTYIGVGDLSSFMGLPTKAETQTEVEKQQLKPYVYIFIIFIILVILCVVSGLVLFLGS